MGSLRESAQALALAPVPDTPEICLAEAEDLLFARDRITCALAERVGRVHRAGQARQHGHASTRSWLRTAGGMTVGGAGRLLTLGIELARLSTVREMFAAGGLAAGVVEAICAAVAGLSDEQAGLAEPILVELAGRAGAAEVAKAGRYLRAVLDPDGEECDERADYGRRSLRVRPGKGGGLEGEFYLPREAAARLRALLDAYARPRAEGDDRSLAERQADAFIALLEQQITTELLVLVNAESLPTDCEPESTTAPAADPAAETAEAPERAGTPEDTVENQYSGGDGTRDAGAAEGDRDARRAEEIDGTDGTDTTGASTVGSGVGGVGGSAGLRDGESGGDVTGRAQARAGQRSESRQEPQQSDQEHSDQGQGEAQHDWRRSSQLGWAKQEEPQQDSPRSSRCSEWRSPDPPGDTHAHYAHAGPRPAREVPHAHSSSQQSSGEQGSGETPRGEQTPGAQPGAEPGAASGASWEAPPGAGLGVGLGMVPGLLLITGQVLPVTSVHRLARTSTLMRIVMDADGQVLDMGRKVRLATPAQRRAIFARYATCWIDGCPLPATLCQIDHADNWSTGGLTDLKLLGPACQFHNRDRYQNPHRYTRHQTGKDRWAFTYHGRTRAWRSQT
ncbi:HNH endonuclease signature motif containing protein [Microbispora sp. H11081]|uniref:HNH endonuclease signature motif containing protein n=1 Tax=Microbispora sp. H11081 TaxID=2729107 RepID=UPI001B8D184C|nr:HNH endonuclease signature motif containing protein [Microbispora sp. H11081]